MSDEYDNGYSHGYDEGLAECEEVKKENTRLRAALAAVTAERDRMLEALRPFGEALKDNYSMQVDELSIIAGSNQMDIRFKWTLGDLRRARAALEGVTKPASLWRDIESAPKDGTPFLAFARGHIDYYGVAEWAEAAPDFPRTVAGCGWPFAIRPTHWMPLPEPPR